MEENQVNTPSHFTNPTTATPKSSQKKWLMLFFILGLIVVAVGLGLFVSQTKKTPTSPTYQSSTPTSITPNPTTTAVEPQTTSQSQAKQTNWKLNNPANHTFVAPDNSFSFTYPAEFAYETIDGTIPQQEHIVYLGKQLTDAQRQERAQKAGVPLTDTLAGISYTTQDIILYYTDTPSFTVTKPEELVSSILSKKAITVGNTPALEAKVDCPTECVDLLLVKGQKTFTFILAKPFGETTPLDTTPLTQIESSFTFSQ